MFMYSVAISAHVKVKQPDMVLELFAVMQQNGMEPDMFMYSAAINACGMANSLTTCWSSLRGCSKWPTPDMIMYSAASVHVRDEAA